MVSVIYNNICIVGNDKIIRITNGFCVAQNINSAIYLIFLGSRMGLLAPHIRLFRDVIKSKLTLLKNVCSPYTTYFKVFSWFWRRYFIFVVFMVTKNFTWLISDAFRNKEE